MRVGRDTYDAGDAQAPELNLDCLSALDMETVALDTVIATVFSSLLSSIRQGAARHGNLISGFAGNTIAEPPGPLFPVPPSR